MGNLSRKKLLLIGFIVIILVAIPLTIFLLSQQQEVRTKAQSATTLSMEPTSSAGSPITRNAGDSIALDVFADPGGVNLIQFIELEILYDPTKISTPEAGIEPIAIEPGSLTLIDGPIYSPGKIALTLSTGVDPSSVISTKQKIATLNLVALADTEGLPTEISFGPSTIISSAGAQDETTENVLSTTLSAFVNVLPSDGSITPSPSGAPNTTPTEGPTPSTSITPTISPTLAASASPTLTPTLAQAVGVAPVCQALEADRAPSGEAPFSITLTARGTDSDGVIEKATIYFGDGQVTDITETGGIGTSTVAASASHTYQSAGTYTAEAVMTDNDGDVSVSGSCTLAVNVSAATEETSTGGDSTAPTNTPVPNLPDTGPNDIYLAIGAAAGFITLLGAIIFLTL